MISEKNRALIQQLLKSDLTVQTNLEYLLAMAREVVRDDPTEHKKSMQIADVVEYQAGRLTQYHASQDNKSTALNFLNIYWESIRWKAQWNFESFCLYMEKDRPFEKQFYRPRMKQLKPVVQALQDLEDDKYDCLCISMPPRVGKSTICIFFLKWIMGKRPDSNNAMGGHSGILAKGFYQEILNLDTQEYRFKSIFPNPLCRLEKKNAEFLEVNYGHSSRFPTLVCRGIDGTWTGAVNISGKGGSGVNTEFGGEQGFGTTGSNVGYLYVDDLIRDRAESLSPQRLEKRYQDFLNVMVDRMNDGSKLLMVGTRWNVLDPIGRYKEKYKDNPRYKFIEIPALNENDESNFQYDYNLGFSTDYYKDMRSRLESNEWQSKYMQKPFVREGLILPPDELRWFNGVLPEGGFVRYIAACDVAWGGGDALSMPIGAEYENGDVYIIDWVFNRGAKEVTIPLVCGKILAYGIQQINFEANNGGEMYAMYVEEWLKENSKHKCSITSTKAPNTMAKMAKIIQYAGDIKRRFIFLNDNTITLDDGTDIDANKRYKKHREYKEAMDEVCMTVQIGKNEHDDAADSLAQLEQYCEGGYYADVEIPDVNPFW